jgi:2-hydroxycyclohexanecarboxyl-CoA dehydrogenase
MTHVVVVTGAAGGIGLGVAERFARDGHKVAMLDTDTALLEREAGRLKAQGASIITATADVASRAQIEAAYAATRKVFGPISIVVANAGIGGSADFISMPFEKWQRMIDVNLTGVFHTIQAAVPDMVAGKWGRIVTISSQAGQSGAPDRAHYCAAKAGVIGFTKALARELARYNITVNTIPPSLVATPMMHRESASGEFPGVDVIAPMIPISRAGMPEDIANACAFLCSDQASYITGQEIGVNGGMYM